MKPIFLLAMAIASLCCPAGNSLEEAFQQRYESVSGEKDHPIGGRILAVAISCLGTPYEAHTLEQKGQEHLVIHFESFDCFTLLEHVLVMARVLPVPHPTLQQYAAELTRVRYRDGRIDGYPSRLHYTSDWRYDNAKKGILKDMTAELGGVPLEKRIDFMSTHREAYPQLADDQYFSEIHAIEARINQRKRHYIPKERVSGIEDRVQNGDLLAITSAVDGLDIAHVGIAIRKQDGRLYMLHASSVHKQVEITAKPLADYLAGNHSQTGIMVFRPLEP